MTITDKFLADVAFGMYVLHAPIAAAHLDGWLLLTEEERSKYRARARFVLSYADRGALDAGRRPA